MNIKNIRLAPIYLSLCGILFILFVSCKEEKNMSKKKEPVYTSYSDSIVAYDLYFPDTVYINELNNGKIIYKGVLDTVITTFGNSHKNRYIRYILTTTDKVDYDYKYLKSIIKDTFGAINNRTIPFYDIKFTKVGVHYIDGIINDNILIDKLPTSKEATDKVRYIENEIRATHKVVVIEKHNK